MGKYFVGQRVAEQRVVDAEVVDGDAALGDAGRAAGLEDVDRLVGEGLGHPAAHRPAAEPFVLERRELPAGRRTILTSLSGSNFSFEAVLQPERAAGRR